MELKFWPEEANQWYESHKNDVTKRPYGANEDIRSEIAKTYPIDLQYIRAVTYDSKSDRYTGVFEGVGALATKNSVKLTHEVAKYLLTNKNHSGPVGQRMVEVFACMSGGAVTDVLLMVL